MGSWEVTEIKGGHKGEGDAWVAQSVKHLAVDFGADHDLTVRRIKPCAGL